MTRNKLLQHINVAFGSLTPLDFFITVKHMKGTVITDVSQFIPLPAKMVNDGQYIPFVQKYGVDQLRNRYTQAIVHLCTHCDGRVLREILNGYNWNHYGMTMPNFAYKAYVEGFNRAITMLNQRNMTYRLKGGAQLGMLKLWRLLPWDAGDVDILVDVRVLGCTQWLTLLQQWADEQQFLHPHTEPAGRTCGNYGVYAMPRGSDVRDPFSLGLISFISTGHGPKIGKTARIRAHGVHAKVSVQLWDTIQHSYDEGALSHKKHNMYHGLEMSRCTHKWQHNCLKDTVGTHLDTCLEYTQFYNI